MMLEDKVVVVTGAARGIGREIALLMAREGAKVVVNEYGGREDGRGAARTPADEVVNEIKAQGGQAAANYDSVATMAGGKSIIQTALDHFGRVDIVVDRAAVPLMREQKWGRFINMTSTSGLVGNVGQANYAAAKLGIVGFTKVVALDMARYNVTANCISPFAWTRMIGTIPSETEAQRARVEKLKQLSPAHIAPMAVYLATDEAKDISGQVFGVRGKEIMLFNHMRPIRSIHHAEGWTPERLAKMFPGTLRQHLVPP